MNNGWNTQIVQVFHEIYDGNFIFQVYFLIILTRSVELSHECINTNFMYQEPDFYSKFFDGSEN